MFLGPRTIMYPAPDLTASKQYFSELLGMAPYFDQDFYVGFDVAGYELALDPHADATRGTVTYWGVADAETAFQRVDQLSLSPSHRAVSLEPPWWSGIQS